MKILPTSQKATDAVRAAQNVNRWGRYAARRFTQKRGVPASLYRLARQLEAQNTLDYEQALRYLRQAG
jgi:hypothetical protein